jgi:hypothetical protein
MTVNPLTRNYFLGAVMKYKTPKQTTNITIKTKKAAMKAVLMKLSTIVTAKPKENGKTRSRPENIPLRSLEKFKIR